MFDLDILPFEPPNFLRNGHAQTIAATVWHGAVPLSGTDCHFVQLPDGDQIAVHENCPQDWRAEDRQVVLLHGLGGCHGSSYLVRVATKLMQVGIRVWRMDARGCGAGVQTARWHHHAGRSGDLHQVIKFISHRTPNSPLSIIGFSLGGNLLLNWLAIESQTDSLRVDSAIAVAPPVDLTKCGKNLNRGLGRGYDWFFGRLMRQRFLERRGMVRGLVDRNVNPLPRKLVHFDDRLTAPLGGFRDVKDYYDRCSSIDKIDRIDIPTLLVVDRHDPVIPFHMFDNLPLSSNLQTLVTQYGGHLGYIGKSSHDPDSRWLDWRLVDWVSRFPNKNARDAKYTSMALYG